MTRPHLASAASRYSPDARARRDHRECEELSRVIAHEIQPNIQPRRWQSHATDIVIGINIVRGTVISVITMRQIHRSSNVILEYQRGASSLEAPSDGYRVIAGSAAPVQQLGKKHVSSAFIS